MSFERVGWAAFGFSFRFRRRFRQRVSICVSAWLPVSAGFQVRLAAFSAANRLDHGRGAGDGGGTTEVATLTARGDKQCDAAGDTSYRWVAVTAADPQQQVSDLPGGQQLEGVWIDRPCLPGSRLGNRPSRLPPVDTIDRLLDNNRAVADGLPDKHLDVRPSRQLAVVTCMDSRLDVFAALGLGDGEAHVPRNAGGANTDDVIRSLALSQPDRDPRGDLIHHTECGRKGQRRRFRAECRRRGGAPAFASILSDVVSGAAVVRASAAHLLPSRGRARLVRRAATGCGDRVEADGEG